MSLSQAILTARSTCRARFSEIDNDPPKKRDDVKSKSSKASELSVGELDATRMYLSEIGYSSLLSAEEEVHFARLSLKGDEAARKRMNRVEFTLGRQNRTSLHESRLSLIGPD